MNRRAFFRSLVLGGIVLPHVPKLILTGGWLPRPGEYVANGFINTLDVNPLSFGSPLTHDGLKRLHALMIQDIAGDDYPLIVSPKLRPEIEAMLESIRQPLI